MGNFILYGVCKLVEGFIREVYFLGLPCRNRPAEFARTSLSACGLPTPIVALACIGNVDIQVFSDADGQVLFLRRLQVCCYKPPMKGEGNQRSWWRGSVESFA